MAEKELRRMSREELVVAALAVLVATIFCRCWRMN